jgi:isopentenyldiphosphate isomerase
MDYLQHASTDDDPLPVVDEHDREIDVLTRREVHLRGLRHRAVHVCVFDPLGRLWLQLRSRAKDSWGGYWDLSATGHVDPGESYEVAARRELREELGIDAEPIFITRLEANEWRCWEFHGLFYLRHAAPIEAFNRAEIEAVRPFARDELERLVATPDPAWPLCPGIVDALPWFTPQMGFGVPLAC